VCEPGRLEEDVMTGKMFIGVNAYREICTLHLAGQVLVLVLVLVLFLLVQLAFSRPDF
jgi:hypothetical protein